MSEEEKFVMQYVSDPAELEEPLPPPSGPIRIYFDEPDDKITWRIPKRTNPEFDPEIDCD